MQWFQLAVALMGEEKAKQLSQKQLELLAQQYADLKGISLPELAKINPEQLGASAVGSMKMDQGLRSKQLQAIGELQNMIDKGGLDYTDKAALEDSLDTSRKQESRARAGVAADAASRGQLNSGSRLLMDMDAAQSGMNNARKTGLETAALAQQRRLAAIRDATSMTSALRGQDWSESESANRAKDLRDERNAAAREKAQYYNAGLPQQQFQNQVTKATGQSSGANNLAAAYGNAATDARGSAAGVAGIIGAAGSGSGSADRGYDPGANTYEYKDLVGDRGGYTDLSKDDPDK